MIKIELSKNQVGLIMEDLESEMRSIYDSYYYIDTWDHPDWERQYNERKELVRVLREELYKV